MELTIGSPIPEYRIKALNSGAAAGNLIHDDEHARRCGFRGGLVSGASIYAYITRCITELFGTEWIERGCAEVRFVHPVYDGEEIRVAGLLARGGNPGTVRVDLEAANPQGVLCGVGTARLAPETSAPEPKPADYPAGHGKRRPISLDLLAVGQPLTPIYTDFTWNVHWEYCQKTIRDHNPLYQQRLHPGWLLSQANLVLAANYDLPAWIHVSSVVRKYHAQDSECVVETRGRVTGKFERNGHHYVVLDLALFTGDRCLETILHTVIFRIAPRAA